MTSNRSVEPDSKFMENARKYIVEKREFLEEIGKLGIPLRKKEPSEKTRDR